MELTEAIRLIQEDINDVKVDWKCPLGQAYKLSFEALKRHRDRDYLRYLQMHEPLPGETPGPDKDIAFRHNAFDHIPQREGL